MGPEDTPGRWGASVEENAPLCLLWKPGPGAPPLGCFPNQRAGQGQWSENRGATVPRNPSPSLLHHPLKTQPLGPTQRWVAGIGGGALARSQLFPHMCLPRVYGQPKGPPTFPRLIRPPLLMSSCRPSSITPPEPPAPQHLAGDPGGALAAGAEARAEGGTPGWRWGSCPVRGWALCGLSAKYTQLWLFTSQDRQTWGQPRF